MRGVILAGGLGTRLAPFTTVTNKHLLPVYDKPMIYYPINTLVSAGIKEVLVVVSGPHAGDFLPILKNGAEFGLDCLRYVYQDKPDGGILDALSLAERFAESNNIIVILGDNVMDMNLRQAVSKFKTGAHIFLKKVPDPSNFGVVKFAVARHHANDNTKSKIIEIVEKPLDPPSNSAVAGVYLFDSNIFNYIKKCQPSSRNQLEVVDAINLYNKNNALTFSYLNGYWHDAGTPDSLFHANVYWGNKCKFESLCETRQGGRTYTNDAIDYFLIWKNIPIKRLGNFTNTTTKIKWQCTKDNFIWEATTKNILKDLNITISCKICEKQQRMLANNIFIDRNISNIKRLENCYFMNKKALFECQKCFHKWNVSPKSLIHRGLGCPVCKKKRENDVGNLLHKLFDNEFEVYHQKFLDAKPLFMKRFPCVDFVLQNKNTFQKIIIEYNGKQHYVPVQFGGISLKEAKKNLEFQQKRDKWVRDYCKERNIGFIEVPYDLSLNEIEKLLINCVNFI